MSYVPPGEISTPLPPPPRRFTVGRFLLILGIIAALVAGATVILLVVGTRVGVGPLLIGVGTAVIPVPVLVACFMWLDRYEPEPTAYLAFCFGWGACVATAISLGVNTFFAHQFEAAGISDNLVAVAVAPVIEETTKALGPLLLFWFRRRHFSGIVDGIVYCGLSATGFAMAENILYISGTYVTGQRLLGDASGAASVAALFVVRILLSGFAHPLFTSMTGVGLGLAARTNKVWVRIVAPVGMLLVAMILHGSWNLLATLGERVLAVGYVSVMVPVFLTAVGGAIWIRAWEARLVARVLPDYVRAGWLTAPEVASLVTFSRRASAREWARRMMGDVGVRAMRGYQFTATRLALLRDGLVRGRPDPDYQREEHELLTSLTAQRAVFTGRDPSVPPIMWDGANYTLPLPDGSTRTVPPPPQPVVPVAVPVMPPPPAPYGYR
ncbi:hypothetical protein Afil01_20540 [Actinorhabdospora filicis]|uniref:RsiW-degrading membrane proteinase PrsW (M82 family) n=1 Tax=Actinorhabdospora filicis TaxID=1785913 RepID=A0A9W6SJT0_9ACTN|nr:PrsW family intramembrane metalloprotease [Actinorhabdospora filicis]GLZ77247.1 hypothetical protein Afil01_20540 [Actinorhabdospora filicis]